MTLSLQDFAAGDTNYVAKFNNNNDSLETAVNGLQTLLAGITGAGVLSLAAAFEALFGTTVSVIGDTSFECGGAGTTLTVQGGYCWRPSLQQVLSNPASTPISFSALPAETYYVVVDATGSPVRTDSATEAVYSVVWTGSAFGTITRLANIVWGAADDIAAQVSTALAASYTSLDDRLEAGETAAAGGALARIRQTGRLSLSVAGAVDVTLSAIEANNTVLNLTGVITANINVIVPLGTNPRLWIVTNNTTGAFTLTVKGATGTGIVVAQGSLDALYQDGTNVASMAPTTTVGPFVDTSAVVVGSADATKKIRFEVDGLTTTTTRVLTVLDADGTIPLAGKPRVQAVAYAAGVTLDCSLYDTFDFAALTGNVSITLSNMADGQKVELSIPQDGTGSRTITFVNTMIFGTDVTALAPSTAPSIIDEIVLRYKASVPGFRVLAVSRGYTA